MVPHNLDVFTNACIHSPNPNHLSSTTFLTPKMELEKPYTRLSHVSDTCISEQPKEIACFTPNMGFYVGPWGLLSSNKKEPHINQNTGWFQPWFHWWSPGQASERQHPHRGQRRSGRKLPWDCSEFRGENSTETLLWNHAFFFVVNQFLAKSICVYHIAMFAMRLCQSIFCSLGAPFSRCADGLSAHAAGLIMLRPW
jgi:hypothetical protein